MASASAPRYGTGVKFVHRVLEQLCLLVFIVAAGAVPGVAAQTVTYIHTDALGSVVAETDVNGNVINRYD